MRSIDRDDTPGLGRKVERPAPAPAQPEWLPTGTPGVERHRDTGHLRNVTPPPAPQPEPIPPWLYIGNPQTWGTAIESLRRECWRQRGK